MRKLTDDDIHLLRLVANAGGSVCPGADARVTPEVHRILRKLERKGILSAEATDDGYRFSLAGVAA